MAVAIYLAMTATEFAHCSVLPAQMGWMACHFSPYGPGLSDLPDSLPEGSLLFLNDRIPIRGHDPDAVAAQLSEWCDHNRPGGILLDFQNPGSEETANLCSFLSQREFPCPVGVSELYAPYTVGPVFLSPCPHHVPLAHHIVPWKNRELWLDLAVNAKVLTLTQSGSTVCPLSPLNIPDSGFSEESLHIHYTVETDSAARFALWRTREDLDALIQEAEQLGIHAFVGLYQELHWAEYPLV